MWTRMANKTKAPDGADARHAKPAGDGGRRARRGRWLVVALFVVAAVAGGVTGFLYARSERPGPAVVPASELSPEVAPSVESIGFNGERAAAAGIKQETVHVRADAAGNPEGGEVSVSSVLRHLGDAPFVRDRSTLRTIVNTEGAEQFLQQGTDLLWENAGESVAYEGTSTQPAPVGVRVSYYLEGQQVSPEQIAGQSGNVALRFDYVQPTGDDQPVYVFATMVLLDHAHFSNIEVTNGACTSMGNMELVSGYVMPQLKDATGLSALPVGEDIAVPEYLEITARATNFQLSGTTTLVTSGLFGRMGKEGLEEGRDVVRAVQELEASSDKILKGLASAREGGDEFAEALRQYTDGAAELDAGAEELRQGIEDLRSGQAGLTEGASQLSSGLASLDGLLANVDTDDLGQSAALFEQARPTIEALAAEVGNADFAALEAQLLAVLDFVEPVLDRLESISGLVSASQLALDGLQGDLDAMRVAVLDLQAQGVDTAELEALLDSASLGLGSAVGYVSEIDASGMDVDVATLRQTIQGLDAVSGQLDALAGALGPFEDLSALDEVLTQVSSLKAGVSALASGASQLEGGIELYTDGVTDLSEGARRLQDGAGQLADGGDELTLGYETLRKGIDRLAQSYEVFDEQGVQALGQLATDEAADVFARMLRLRELDERPRSFSGHDPATTVDVRYLVETDKV